MFDHDHDLTTPTAKCSNPDCEYEGAFTVNVVIENIVRVIGEDKTIPIESSDPLFDYLSLLARITLGDGEIRCHASDSYFCEGAIGYRNHMVAKEAFGGKRCRIAGTELLRGFYRRLDSKERVRIDRQIEAMMPLIEQKVRAFDCRA